MINHLDNILRDLLLNNITELSDEAQVRFQPPDEAWRSYISTLTVGGQPANALNVYLADLRENRRLRSNARTRQYQEGLVNETPAPARLDCHYLITAWSPATVSPATEPTVDEHTLLYQVAGVLLNSAPLNPARIYPVGSAALSAVPALIREADLPTQVLPGEGFAKLAEFWGTMGTDHRWKPAVYLIVTLPVALPTESAGPLVTTRITEYRRNGRPETAESWVQIGGHVLNSTVDPPALLAKAWVQLASAGGDPLQTTESNDLGRFTFADLQPGQYQLNWRAAGYPPPAAPRLIEVPSPTGEYDLTFV